MALLVSSICEDGHDIKVGTNLQLMAIRGEIDVDATLADGDILKLAPLPAGCMLVDAFIDTDDLDTNVAPALVMDLGIINATDDGLTTVLLNDTTIGQGGGLARIDTQATLRLAPSTSERFVGIEIITTAATPAASGTVGLTLLYRLDNTVYTSQLTWRSGHKKTIASNGLVAVRGEIDVLATLKEADVLKFAPLPAGMTLVDIFVDADDLDAGTTPALVMDIGVLNTACTAVESTLVLMNDTTAGQAAGLTRGSLALIARVSANNTLTRTVGAVVVTRASKPANGTIGFTMVYRNE